MQVAMLALVGVLVGLLLVVTAIVAVIGLLAVVSGERLARCPLCNRTCWTAHGRAHPDGCPPHSYERTLARYAHGHLHLRHH